ncbi:MAG TPA: peptidoglycan DD-metalloendopeptidase family protein [Ferruginibacter sp.]|nr:peptidoglycan DD-metalloendopeptidase family protein [Ferruginibacter sp.]HMP19761.1 peptidoglycan DD-metalloendopeptidase family protein [Ferruginibacter sp.]
MKKVKYFYNTNTLRYEKLVTPLRVKLLRFFGFISALLVSSALVIWLYTKFIPNPSDKQLQMKYDLLKDNYNNLNNEVKSIQQQMAELEKRDNEVYRSIFEANPLPDSARAKLTEKKKEVEKINAMSNDELSMSIAASLNNIKARVVYQRQSYDDIEKLIKSQDVKLASIPAIQPVSNKNLTRIASGFGMRIHPIYGIPKMHYGLDFTAPQGTPIFATGDGVVKEAGPGSGTGNHVVINHGYGYETEYMHMVRIKVRERQRVKRGEVIGWVGSTGASTGPHCHYEVHVNGHPVDPVYFFYNDLTPEQYDRVLKIAATGSARSFD